MPVYSQGCTLFYFFQDTGHVSKVLRKPELGPKVLQVAALAEAEREQAPIGGRVSGLGWFRVSGMYYKSRGTW